MKDSSTPLKISVIKKKKNTVRKQSRTSAAMEVSVIIRKGFWFLLSKIISFVMVYPEQAGSNIFTPYNRGML